MQRARFFGLILVIILSTTSVAASPVNRKREQERSALANAVDYLASNWMPIAGTVGVVAFVYYLTRENRVAAPLLAAGAGAGHRDVRQLRKEWLTKVESQQPKAPQTPPQDGQKGEVSASQGVQALLARQALARTVALQEAQAQEAAARRAAVEKFIALAKAFRECQLKHGATEEMDRKRDELVSHLLVDVEARVGAINEIVVLEEFWNLFIQDGHLIVAKIIKSDFAIAVQYLVDRRARKCLECLRKDLLGCFKNLHNAHDGEGLSLAAKLAIIDGAEQSLGF